MSQISKALLGAVAITVALGAAQLASGHDLADRWQAVADKPSHNINRAGKADRIADPKPSAVPTRTVSTRLNDLKDTSVLLRVPAVIETGNAAKAPTLLQKNRKPTIACEPVVSSLTEVAKLLQPGRCVT
ncbi:hypothetical protein C2U70_03240 [Bradyrhizobium guangdongense]|uniref:hypothetical protein n=1 Tax=Bradyrhizobium guangdongense TaxID=1325090 RepID=UPI0011290F69|nr:hypothetical protein [Bradyrhizobium guangdongense]TPQ41338.1 hypothetical protein C2U70_03240 [Bradyrhizobium guangdongense]